MNWNAKEFRQDALAKCRKHKPGKVTAKEYFICYILSFYPDTFNDDLGQWVENECIFQDFKLRLDALAESLVNELNPVTVAPSNTIITQPKLF
jgi:hypothetical protein